MRLTLNSQHDALDDVNSSSAIRLRAFPAYARSARLAIGIAGCLDSVRIACVDNATHDKTRERQYMRNKLQVQ